MTVETEDFAGLGLIGNSPPFLEALRKVACVADLDVTVTIYGETGTGKELIARAIHYSGNRSAAPFVPVNCGALPDTLFENEMFGHERGSFTDARSKQAGLVELADSGTLFLDEVEALTPKAQAGLLRFLQEKSYRPLGAKADRVADVRIIAATNETLSILAQRRQFRRDLYYRLSLIPINLPALRERGADIHLLTDYFVTKYQHQYDMPGRILSAAAQNSLLSHDWPGNIRELENALHRAFVLAEDDTITASDLFSGSDAAFGISESGPSVSVELPFQTAKSMAIEQFEKQYLSLLMEKFAHNISAAARHARKDRAALSRMVKKHGM